MQSWVLDQHIESKGSSPVLENAKRLISSVSDIPEVPVTPTDLGVMLAEKKQYPKPISARKINQMLIAAGLQTAIKRTGKSGKKKIVYQLTEVAKQEELGHLQITTKKPDGSMVFQVRWFKKVLNCLE